MCGSRYAKKAEAQEEGVEITVTLRPQTLPELFDALAVANGSSSGRAYLETKGASAGVARQMMSGAVIDTSATVKVIDETGITAGDFIKLLKSTVSSTGVATKGGSKKDNACPDCGVSIGPNSKRCRQCSKSALGRTRANAA